MNWIIDTIIKYKHAGDARLTKAVYSHNFIKEKFDIYHCSDCDSRLAIWYTPAMTPGSGPTWVGPEKRLTVRSLKIHLNSVSYWSNPPQYYSCNQIIMQKALK